MDQPNRPSKLTLI